MSASRWCGITKEVRKQGLRSPSVFESTGHAAERAAKYWRAYEGRRAGKKAVICELCPHRCVLEEDDVGRCGARANRAGQVVALYYGRASSLSLDPIEKKPLYHFYPGREILSIGSVGCNLECFFCQNWEIAHEVARTEEVTPAQLVALARRYDSIGIAYTYNEPLMNIEFLLEAGAEARREGLVNVLVSNGSINPEPLDDLLPLVDAVNLDVKGFTDDYYRRNCGGWLGVVKANAKRFRRAGVHVELTTLLLPGENDTQEEIARLVEWIEAELGKETPLHLSRYFPNYKSDLPPTPPESLLRAAEVASRQLAYVYVGNLVLDSGSDRWQNTICPQCSFAAVERHGYHVRLHLTEDGNCPRCGYHIAVVAPQ